MTANTDELLTLYQNAADNIFYFKNRVFWLTASFSAGTAFLWNMIDPAHKSEDNTVFFLCILMYFFIASLTIILSLFSYRKKIEAHRERIDRSCGLFQIKTGRFMPKYEVRKTGKPALSAQFFYGRTGHLGTKADGKYDKPPKFMAVHNDWADNLIGLTLVLHVVAITLFTAHKFSMVFLTDNIFFLFGGVYVAALFLMALYCKFYFNHTGK